MRAPTHAALAAALAACLAVGGARAQPIPELPGTLLWLRPEDLGGASPATCAAAGNVTRWRNAASGRGAIPLG